MQPLSRRGRPRAAISGQRGSQPLRLGEGSAGPSNTNRDLPPRGTGLTDAQMMEAERSWCADEASRCGSGGYHARNLNNPLALTRIEGTTNNSTPQAVNYGIQQHDGTIVELVQNGKAGMLLTVDEGRNLRASLEREKLSKPYFWACSLTPVTALAFGLGAFDRVMRNRTEGRIRTMDAGLKWQARWVAMPLSALLWAIVIVLVIIALVAGKRH